MLDSERQSEEYAETTGAVLGGRNGFDRRCDLLSCDVAEAARIGLDAAGGKNLQVFSVSIGRQRSSVV